MIYQPDRYTFRPTVSCRQCLYPSVAPGGLVFCKKRKDCIAARLPPTRMLCDDFEPRENDESHLAQTVARRTQFHAAFAVLCPVCEEPASSIEDLPPETGRPGGLMCPECVEATTQPECTCYEAGPGHMPGCPMRYRAPLHWIHEGALVWYNPSPGYRFRAIAAQSPVNGMVPIVVLDDEAFSKYHGVPNGHARSKPWVPAAAINALSPRLERAS